MNNVTFEAIKKINEFGSEFWSARELQTMLGYSEWRNFERVIDRAKSSCLTAGNPVDEHFVEFNKMVILGSGGERSIVDLNLSRYACYLIAQNGDPKKPEIALAQMYFALQTRKQEMSELLIEDSKRTHLRKEMKEHNKKLFETAKGAGVENYGRFQNYGYQGLYGGRTKDAIHKEKGLNPKQDIQDHMGSEEMAANLFRTTQTDAKIKREGIKGERKASEAHYDVGLKIRKTIEEIGGTMPEKLPVAESIKLSEKRLKGAEKLKGPENQTNLLDMADESNNLL